MQRPRDSTSETRQWADGGGRSSGAWCLVAALGSSWRVGVMLFSKSGETLEPPSPLHSAWSLRSAPLGARASCCFRSRGKSPNPRLRCARPGRCARLLLARGRHVVFEVGENPRTPVSAALDLIAALGSFGMRDCMAACRTRWLVFDIGLGLGAVVPPNETRGQITQALREEEHVGEVKARVLRRG